jgi:hypothetical protein
MAVTVIKTYDDLVEAVADWMNRTDLGDMMQQFISLVESEASRVLRVPSMEKRIVQPIAEGALLLPQDFLEAKNIVYITGSRRVSLERVSLARLNTYLDRNVTNGEIPRYFTRIANQLAFAPPATDSDLIETEYYGAIRSLAPDGQYPDLDPTNGNWLLAMAPEVYLYGCLKEASMYVKDLERAQYWETKFKQSVINLQNMADGAEWAGSELAMYS